MRKMKKFADGGSDKYKARYDRKVADIESDYEKAKARKTGRAAEVAKAKYEQRMADAKDDLAKWTKGDRTQTRAAEAAAERELTMTRRYGARKIPGLEDADKPLVSARPSDAELTKLTAGVGQKLSDAGNFGSAFRAARKAGDKTFTWRGKSYTTEMAGERPAARPAARPATGGGNKPPAPAGRGTPPAAGRGTPPATGGRGTPPAAGGGNKPAARTAPSFTPSFADKRAAELRAGTAADRKLENAPTGTPGAAAARLKKYLGVTSSRESSARALEQQAQRKRWQDVEAQGAKDAFEARKAGKLEELRRAAEAPGASGLAKSRYRYAKETGMVGNLKKGGSVKGYAKGGKIDGCAVRGKTKAMRKK